MPDLVSGGPLKITKELLLEIGGWRAMKEGLSLWESSKVQEVTYAPPLLFGTVQTGTTSVKARLQVGHRLSDVENLCSCRQAREYGTVCSHVIALGLEYITPKGVKAAMPFSNGSGVGQGEKRPCVPDLRCLPLSEMSETVRRLELYILVPHKFQEAWNTGEMRIICEASLDKQPAVPLDNFLSAERAAYALSDADTQALDTIRRLNQGEIRGMWMLPAKKFAEFFLSLVGHRRVSLGKTGGLEIRRAQHRTALQMNLLENGDLQLHLDEPRSGEGVVLQSTHGQWLLNNNLLEYLNGLPVSYLSLRTKDMVIPRAKLAHFFQYEIPHLERQVELRMGEGCNSLQFGKTKPKIHVTLDGMLSGLSCKIEASYGDGRFLLKGGSSPDMISKEEWKPDPNDPRRYFIRDRDAEQEVISLILAAGFQPGQRQPELYSLTGEGRVGFFLANVLMRWSSEWDITFSTRLHELIGKCDRIEPEVSITSSGEDWLSVDIDFREASGKSALTHIEVQRLLNMGVSHQRMASGRIALLPTQSVREFQEVIRDCQVEQTGSGMKVSARYAAYLGNVLAANGWHLTARSQWQPPQELTDYDDIVMEPDIEAKARPYQKTGVGWLHHLARNSMSGILADEMGLGKTFQMLAYLLYRKKNGLQNGPALIVSPTSLVLNWQDEALRFTPELSTLVLHGAKRQSSFDKIKDRDIVITSYALLRRDVEMYKEHEFSMVVLDEAQHIKNKSSQNALCAKRLKAKHRFVLTGTPIENSLLDLWSIFDFLMPGYLGPAMDFKRRYEVPITKQNDNAAHSRLRERVRPFILRRTKSEVAKELPEKFEHVMSCELSDEQKEVYQRILDQGRRNVFDNSSAGNGQSKEKSRLAILTALMRLRQVCCHLGLLPVDVGTQWKEPSAKLDTFFELLDQAVDGGHRMLVFSQFVSMLKLLEEQLKARGITYCYLDGSTLDRKGQIVKFQGDDSIPLFLISLKAGGTGINLTGADMVVHFDPWWNPAVEEQATARAHRIGQSKIVTSYKLIARGTVEEKIVNLQRKKSELVANTLVSEEAFIRSLSWEELQSLLE